MATSPSLDILFFARPLLVLIVPAKVLDPLAVSTVKWIRPVHFTQTLCQVAG